MPTQKFLIAPVNTGLDKANSPWIIPDDAFEQLNNAQLYRGRIVKRFGSRYTGGSTATQVNSRLRVKVGTTNAFGVLNVEVPGAATSKAIGKMFSIGDYFGTITSLAAGNQELRLTYAVVPPLANAWFNSTNNHVETDGADFALLDVYYYPQLPVMGFAIREDQETANREYYAFDTQFSYIWDQTTPNWNRFGLAGDVNANIWTGGNSNFFWSQMYTSPSSDLRLLFTSNFNSTEPMRYYNKDAVGALAANSWYNFQPIYSDVGSPNTYRIRTAKAMVYFKEIFFLMNLIERNSNDAAPESFVYYPGLVRYTARGANPIDVAAFRRTTNGAGFINPPTQEAILSAKVLKDHLIVYFEHSIYELVYTYNNANPLIWKLISNKNGTASQNSPIEFDSNILTIGLEGINSCDGANVKSIDDKIPDEVFDMQDKIKSELRVYGVRDFKDRFAYWTMPSEDAEITIPYTNKVLTFSYDTGAWSFVDDSITAFGHFREGSTAPENESFERVVAGNQQGFVFVPDLDIPYNASVLSISNLVCGIITPNEVTVTCLNHNLRAGDWIQFSNIEAFATMNDLNGLIFQVDSVTDKDTFVVIGDPLEYFAGIYYGAGTISRVTPIDILTKQYNFFNKEGKNAFIPKIDFLVDKTTAGKVLVDTNVSSTPLSTYGGALASGSLIGKDELLTYAYPEVNIEQYQTRLWHSIFPQAEGDCVRLEITLVDVGLRAASMLRNPDIANAPFVMHAILFYAMPTANYGSVL